MTDLLTLPIPRLAEPSAEAAADADRRWQRWVAKGHEADRARRTRAINAGIALISLALISLAALGIL